MQQAVAKEQQKVTTSDNEMSERTFNIGQLAGKVTGKKTPSDSRLREVFNTALWSDLKTECRLTDGQLGTLIRIYREKSPCEARRRLKAHLEGRSKDAWEGTSLIS
jgi:hypothetical protein